MNLNSIVASVIELSEITGHYLRESVGHLQEEKIRSKAQSDFVTEVDKESERRLVMGLEKILPEAGYIAEEGTSTRRGARYDWIIDPLDGTTNFIHGVIPFSISIALAEQGVPILGVVTDPIQKETFSAIRDGEARLNGKSISVSQCKELKDALVGTGFPYTDFSLIDPYLASLRDLMGCTHGVRRLGSAAMDLAYVACGRYDAFYEYHLKPWDVAAGSVIIQQAGGQIGDFYGTRNWLFGETYLASNGKIHREFVDLIGKYFT